MATYNFTVRYYGKALDAHRIPVRDLAPSLLALSEAFQKIQHIQNPTEPDLSLDIQASDNGSFLVDLILANGPDLLNRAMNLLNSQPSTALINLSGYVALFIDAVQLIQKLANKKISSKESHEGEGTITLTLDDQTKITISKAALQAFQVSNFVKVSKQRSTLSIRKESKELNSRIKKNRFPSPRRTIIASMYHQLSLRN